MNCNQAMLSVLDRDGSVYVGVWDTNNIASASFDVSPWINAFGDGSIMVIVQRPGERIPYIAANVAVSAGVATWTFDEVDTAIEGIGACSVIFLQGDERRGRTVPFTTYVAPTIGPAAEEPPEPLQRWYDDIMQASADAIQAAVDAAESERNAEASARSAAMSAADAHADATAAYASAAAAAGSAADAAESAGDAQRALEGMVYVTFGINPEGHVFIKNGDLLGTTAFELIPVSSSVNPGHMEVSL